MGNQFSKWAIFIVLCMIWGSSFKLMHDSQLGLNAIQIAALRIFSAGVVFIPFAFFHIRKIPRRKMALVIFTAVLGNLLPAFLFAEAITKLDSSLAGILNALTPLCVVVIGIFFFKDHIKKQKILGVITGFVGLVLLTLLPMALQNERLNLVNFGYTFLIVAATFFYGFNINLVGHYLKNVNPVHVATVSIASMTIPTGFILWQQHFFALDFTNATIQYSVGASVILGVAGSAIATALFYILVKKAGILFSALVTYGVPFIAMIWGIFDGENITWVQWFCLFIILAGVYLANLPDKKKATSIDIA